MRILVFSDTHGDLRTMMNAIKTHSNAEVIIHCGDGERQVEELKMTYPDKKIIAVRGNCDWSSMLPNVEVQTVGGKKIFVTHGHIYNAKLTIYNLVCAAREEKADILLFGHTHCAMTDYDDGLYIMNPGSCHGYGATYGFIDITDKGEIVTNIVKVAQ
jgi:putative phosphoesterase